MTTHKESITLKEKFPWLTSGFLSSLRLKTSSVLFAYNVHIRTWFVFGCGFVSEYMYVVWFCFMVLFICYFSKWPGWIVLQQSWACHSEHCPAVNIFMSCPFGIDIVSGLVRKYILLHSCVCVHASKTNTEIKTTNWGKHFTKPSRPKESQWYIKSSPMN